MARERRTARNQPERFLMLNEMVVLERADGGFLVAAGQRVDVDSICC